MRKILAAFLAVMMLVGVLAALPVSAADAAATSAFDGTTSDEKIDLVVTEVLINSKTNQPSLDNQLASGSVSVYSSPDAFDYIEIYNRGTTPVNLFDYVILSANSKEFTGTVNTSSNEINAQTKYALPYQNIIVPGSIHDDNNAAGAASGSLTEYNKCENPTDRNQGVLEPGKIAVIWFWTSATDQLCNLLGETSTPVGTMWENDSRSFPYFRTYYGIDDDVLVLATNAKASKPTGTNNADVYNDLRNGYTYALAKNTYKFGNKAVTSIGSKTTLDANIVTMFEYSTNTNVGIPTTDNMDDMSAYYLPANCTPDLRNTNAKNLLETDEEKAAFVGAKDYVEIGYARSFRECAIVTYTEEPTPGGLTSWQWMYLSTTGSTGLSEVEASLYTRATNEAQALVDAEEITADQKDAKIAEIYNDLMAHYVTDWADAGIKDSTTGRLMAATGETTWLTVSKTKFLTDYVAEIVEEEDNAETKKDYAAGFVDREVLEQRHNQKGDKTTKNDGGLPVWALILIIVGGVLVLGGVAVVVIIVIKKKNKPVAADDVAAEGEIAVIDETAADAEVADAPAAEGETTEAPAEDAPADEDKQ